MPPLPPLPPEEGRQSMAERERKHYQSLVEEERMRKRRARLHARIAQIKSLFRT